MQDQANAIEDLFSKTNDYLETKGELLKLKAIGKTSAIASSLVSGVVIGTVCAMVAIFLHIGIAIWLGNILGTLYQGFFAVGGFYLVVLLVLYFTRKQFIKTPVKNLLIKNILN